MTERRRWTINRLDTDSYIVVEQSTSQRIRSYAGITDTGRPRYRGQTRRYTGKTNFGIGYI